MTPILYSAAEMSFTSNGLARLVDCIDCRVYEERNGIFECEFVYPMDGDKFDLIEEGRIIFAAHDETGEPEPFDIYGHSAPIDGKVTFYAHHISYRQCGLTVRPFTASNCAAALLGLKSNSINTNPFNYWTDKDVTANYSVTYPRAVRSLLAGEEGSILSVYGKGEYKFEKFDVKLYTNRGENKGVTIRYGKNLVDFNDELDFSDSYNGIVPYWVGQDEDGNDITVTLPEGAVMKSGATYDGRDTIIPYDFSGDFENAPDEEDLRTRAESFLNNTDPRLPLNTLTVNFVELWQTEEYKEFAPLQSVNLCDTVTVIYPRLNVNVELKVVKTVYNTLLDRYDEIQLGDTPQTYAEVITEKLANESKLAYQLSRWAQGWATDALKLAGDDNQYFWLTETGTDTGAHVTEIPREDFLTDPANGGGNLLVRSNGVAVRYGLSELTSFGANGVTIFGPDGSPVANYGATTVIGDANGFHVEVSGNKIAFFEGETEVAYINNNRLYISQSVVLDEMQVGESKWSWKLDKNDYSIYLKWIG